MQGKPLFLGYSNAGERNFKNGPLRYEYGNQFVTKLT